MLLLIMTTFSSCKKDENEVVVKNLDYITDIAGFFKLEMVYMNNVVAEMHYLTGSDTVKFIFENGLLKEELYPNGGHIDYIRNDNEVKEVRSWAPNNIEKIYHLNNDNKVVGLTNYKNGIKETGYEYIYSAGNLIEEKKTFPNNISQGIYTYDTHPNPYRDITIYNDLFTYSTNNHLTKSGESVAEYKYDNDGYVIEANYQSGAVTYLFTYK